MSLLEVTQLSHIYGERQLYRDAQIILQKGEHVGVVGPNGIGKSTLLRICTGEVVPDSGRIVWRPGVTWGSLDQHAQAEPGMTVLTLLQSAFSALYATQEEMNACYARCETDPDAFERAAACQSRLEKADFYTADVRIGKVANGLGLTAIGLDRKLSELSGGQRAKAILAKLLLENPDVLLLDEPTNYLDREHIAWLSDELAASEKAFLIVSHDTAFLEAVCTSVCDLDNQKLCKYSGRYSEFLKQKAHLQEDYARRYRAQQREIQKTEEYIRRNIAGVNSKNAKGRRKQLERVERMAPPEETQIRPLFTFPALNQAGREALRFQSLSVGYGEPLLSDLQLTVAAGEKLVVTGFNGIGKSTLIKTLVGQVRPLQGTFRFAPTAVLGYYDQELFWQDAGQTPIAIVSQAYPALSGKEVRRELSRCGISAAHALQPVATLSGGEQAKVRLCLLTMHPCNFLLLDEPTNHLDAQAKQALREALDAFSGTVLLVSHETAFYREWAHRVVNLEEMRG